MQKIALLLSMMSLGLVSFGANAEQSQVRIGLGRPLGHLPLMVMEHEHLLEKHAAAVGEPNVKIVWERHASSSVGSDALLAGEVDILSAGAVQAILLWSKTRGTPLEVKSIAAVSSLPTLLTTRNPALHSIRDLTDKDRIGLSGVKVSFNAMLLQMAAAKEFGKQNYARLDPLTVSRSAPDSMAALLSPASEIDCDFSIPPYTEMEMRQPGIHVILSSTDILGKPPTFGLVIATSKFHDKNPKLYRAFFDALDEAMQIIATDEQKTAASYLALGDKFPADVMHAVLNDPQTKFVLQPSGTLEYAKFMQQTGLIPSVPASWKEMFFPEAAGMDGS